MTARIPQNVSTWLVDGSIVTTTGNTMPPRDPNDDDDEEDEEGEAEPDDDLDPAVVREPVWHIGQLPGLFGQARRGRRGAPPRAARFRKLSRWRKNDLKHSTIYRPGDKSRCSYIQLVGH
jgi:hypothetical protein